jgi:hypothetical protein
VEKALRGKAKTTFPFRWEFPEKARDSHFPAATAAAFPSPPSRWTVRMSYYDVYGILGAGQLSKQRNKHLQTTLIEAAKMAPRYSPTLALLYDREKQRGNANRATLAVARKLVAYLVAVDRREKNKQPKTHLEVGTKKPGRSVIYTFSLTLVQKLGHAANVLP